MNFFPLSRLSASIVTAWLGWYGLAHAADDAPSKTPAPVDVEQLSSITVQTSADASASGLAPEYAGGQVARGARVGVLGTRDAMETPFSTVSYTNQLMQDQQARSVADVLQNDPTVRVARGFGIFGETYFIRGFITGAGDTAYNGLYGLLPRQYTAVEMVERVEVLRGASAFLYGSAPSGDTGGTINLVPKRATAEPLTAFTLGTASGGPLQFAADISRRFGDADRLGVRVNLARRHGDTALARERTELDLASVGVDWRGARTRLSADLGWQDNQLHGIRPSVTLTNTVTTVPDAPDNKVNFAQPWTRSNERDLFGTLRGEFDVSDAVTAWAALGLRDSKEFNSLAGVQLSNATTGDGTAYRFDNRRRDKVQTGEVGLRGTFRTGAVTHELMLSASHFDHKSYNAVIMDFLNLFPNNIYAPNLVARPDFINPGFVGGDINQPGLLWRARMHSFTLGDTLSFLDGRLQVIAGVRHQRLRHTDYNYVGVVSGTPYDDSRTSPVLGVVYKLNDRLSVYANYIEGLARGASAPMTFGGQPVVNGGQMLAPFVSKQKEIGIKYDGGSLGASLALFTTDKPHAFVNSSLVFSAEGKDRHRGAELTAYGQPWRGVRVLGGMTLLDAKQRNSGVAANHGKRVIGVAKQQANLGVEWDVQPDWTISARAIATASRYADAANTLRVPGWVRYDLGARYTLDLPGEQLLTLRLQIENVSNRNDWISVGGYPGSGYLVLGNPRTLKLNATWEF